MFVINQYIHVSLICLGLISLGSWGLQKILSQKPIAVIAQSRQYPIRLTLQSIENDLVVCSGKLVSSWVGSAFQGSIHSPVHPIFSWWTSGSACFSVVKLSREIRPITTSHFVGTLGTGHVCFDFDRRISPTYVGKVTGRPLVTIIFCRLRRSLAVTIRHYHQLG